MFDFAQKSSKFLLEIMTLVSSANIMDSVKVFVVGGWPFMYIMKMKDPRIDPWRTPCFIVPSLRKNCDCFQVILLRPFVFYLLDRI
jgi:hypothetical protein